VDRHEVTIMKYAGEWRRSAKRGVEE